MSNNNIRSSGSDSNTNIHPSKWQEKLVDWKMDARESAADRTTVTETNETRKSLIPMLMMLRAFRKGEDMEEQEKKRALKVFALSWAPGRDLEARLRGITSNWNSHWKRTQSTTRGSAGPPTWPPLLLDLLWFLSCFSSMLWRRVLRCSTLTRSFFSRFVLFLW